jgi:hypothetical protein
LRRIALRLLKPLGGQFERIDRQGVGQGFGPKCLFAAAH